MVKGFDGKTPSSGLVLAVPLTQLRRTACGKGFVSAAMGESNEAS
jgi:hypothetical protein